MQKKTSSIKLQANKFLFALFSAGLLSSCEPKLGEVDPTYLYDQHKDKEAMEMAQDQLGSRFDLLARAFIVRANLSRYIDTHDPVYALEIEKYYGCHESLDKELSRDVATYESSLQETRYLDAGILLFVKNDPEAARKLLDSYCPSANFRDYVDKMNCHFKNAFYFHDASSGRNDLEESYLFNITLGVVYHDQYVTGNAMGYKAQYDIENAQKQIEQYLKRNAWNDEVMKRYCDPVYLYGSSEYGENRKKYAAASQHANCPLYVELAKKEEEEAERAAKHPDIESTAPAPVSRQ